MQHLAWLRQGRPQGKQKCGKNGDFWLTHWLEHRITRKLLKIDRYMLRGPRGLASIEFSFHPCNILRDSRRGVSRGNKNVGCRGVPRANKKWRPGYVKMAIFCNCGSNNWETVVDRRVHAARHFYCMTLCKRGLCCHVVSVCSSVCLSACPSVTFVHHVKTNKYILEFFSPPGSHTFLVWQNVLQYLNNFTKQHRAICQR